MSNLRPGLAPVRFPDVKMPAKTTDARSDEEDLTEEIPRIFFETPDSLDYQI
jgi:hypothetical protein